MSEKTALMWSSGKDAAYALFQLQQQGIQVDRLLTTVNESLGRVTMHGLSLEMLNAQLQAVNIPFQSIFLPEKVTNEVYNREMSLVFKQLKEDGFTTIAFGDIFLEDLKLYREKELEKVGLKAIFPLWKKNTASLFKEMINQGLKAVVICVNGSVLDKSFIGRELSNEFLNDLPENVDPCGENGEFHTFCYHATYFNHPVRFYVGQTVEKKYSIGTTAYPFWFCELHLTDKKL